MTSKSDTAPLSSRWMSKPSGLTPRAGAILWPTHSFVEAYNSHRYEINPSGKTLYKNSAPVVTRPSKMLALQDQTPREPEGNSFLPRTFSRHSEQAYGYTLIRSDVDEDRDNSPAGTIPQMPDAGLGVRQRKLVDIDEGLRQLQDLDEVKGPMPWVESPWFQGFSGVVIFVNATVIGLETDIDSPYWFWVEQALLGFFVFELSVRMLRNGVKFFQHEDDWVWNLFDFSIVMSGVLDTWMMPLSQRLMRIFEWHKGKGSHMTVVLLLMRMGRLLRIVRLFRLVRIVRPLFELAMGVLEALQGMFWVLVFMIMTLYATAILCTRLIGHGTLLHSDDPEIQQDLDEIKKMFNTVAESMFTLFGTVSSWSLLKFVPLFEEMPLLRPFFVLFYVYSAWALLAVMTGVVSENMIAIREQMLAEDRQKEDARRATITEHLLELFNKADTDGSGTVTREEFDAMLARPDLIKKIQKNAHMRISDMRELYEWIDHDGSGAITIDEFMAGFKWVSEPLRAKSLVKLQERLSSDLRHLEHSVLERLYARASEVKQIVAQPLRKVYAITEQLQNLDVHLADIRTAVREQASALPTPQELLDTEARLSKKLSAVTDKLAEIESRARARR